MAPVPEVIDTPIGSVVRRSSFPSGFVFGSASSAYQYEGAAFKYGKGASIWDIYTHKYPERIDDRSNGDVALDSYHRYKEYIAIMKQIGLDVYRFSIAWTRILPYGRLSGGVNREGIQYYNNLINELLANGIKPFVTIFHWDVPQALQDEYQGPMNRQFVNDFREFAELCFKEFGDRVKHWITLNEEYIFTLKGYVLGQYAPGRGLEWDPSRYIGGDSGTEPYFVGHHLILAHAAAVNVYRTKYQANQKGIIGLSFAINWYVPYSDSEADRAAAGRALDFSLGWFLHPLVYGDYPRSMRFNVKERLPKFTADEVASMIQSFDFIGINYYTANYAKNNPNMIIPKPSYLNDIHATLSTDRNGVPIGPKAGPSSWLAVYPQGLKDLLVYIKNMYRDPTIYITENGYFDYDSPNVDKLIMDKARIKYYHDHLYYLHEAMNAGVRVKGYFVWTLLDDFEWASGYTIRFGMTYVDFKNNLKTLLKESAIWFNNFLKT
ncbi:cyanogenic beta-glucosidase-like [Momordica charantia]|uniref:Cyanogenic beta-glucosidase-like n=1 Tax=Momordica charantia TaxID=3673 RepID=A0A6J1DJ88_MOMCH|nr:cyanogenic beta-glucosidase-like [Momordica charantia]